MGKVTLQIVRDGVVRFNAEGPDGLRDRKPAGPIPLLTDAHRAALLEIIERGPTAAISAGTRSEIGRDCRDGFLSLATRPATNWVSQSGIIWAAGSRWWGLRSLNHSTITSEQDSAPPDRRPRQCFRSRHPCDRWRSERAAPACPHFCPVTKVSLKPLKTNAYRLLNWKLLRALALPYFLRSTVRESRVRKPATLRMARRSGS